MIVEKTLLAVAAGAAIAAAAATSVVAAFFALYAFVLPMIGAAGAAAVVAGTAALFAVIVALVLVGRLKGKRPRPAAAAAPPPQASLIENVIGIARAHPILSAGVAIAAGVYGLRNPEIVAAVIRGFSAPKPGPTQK